MHRRGGRAGGRGERGQRSQPFRAPQPGDWKFGTVYALKDTFGFLRPMHRAEDVYFSLRDAPRDVQQDDFVYYLEEEGSKGPAARELNHLPFHEQSITASSVKAIVKADASNPSRKGTAGMLTIQDSSSSLDGYDVPFVADDVAVSVRTLFLGDMVECDVAEIPRLGYLRAQNIRVVQSARELRRAKEVQLMLEAGLARDQGVIDTLKGDYGFIRCADRKDDVYFRVDDVNIPAQPDASAESSQDSRAGHVTAGMEVEFFIISEASKDGLRNQAVHIDILPRGTVQFEVAIKQGVVGMVSVLPRVSGAKEVPGIVSVSADQYDGSTDAPEVVELWPRVMATTLDLQQGDVLQFDIMKYRPESIYFARNVSVKEFNPLLREWGVVTRVKEGNFGFIRSAVRENDVYFRFEDMLQADGRPMEKDQIAENMTVSYDCSIVVDDRPRKQQGKQDAPRWRATRITPCDPELCRDYYVLQRNFRGVVLKEAQKQNQAGTVKVTGHPAKETTEEAQSNDWRAEELGEIEIPPEIEFQDIENLLQRFMQDKGRQEIALAELPSTHKRALALLCDRHKLGYESQTAVAGGLGPSLMRVWKFATAEEFAEWALSKPPIVMSRKDKRTELLPFSRAHTNEKFGVVSQAAEVTFSLCVDRRTLTRFAGEITLTDKPLAGGDARRSGVVDTIRAKGKANMHGYIRDFETQEKLSFHGHDFQEPVTATQVSAGSIVSYELRNRGGFRAAVAISVEADQPVVEQELPEQCTAVIVEQGTQSGEGAVSLGAVLVDTSGVPALADVYINLQPGMAGTGSGTELTKESTVPGEPPVRYFAPAPRAPVPLVEGAEVAVGDLVHCTVTVNQAASRLPIRARVTGRVDGSTQCPKVEGTISRLEAAIGEVAIDAKLLGEPAEEMKSTGAFGNTVLLAFDPRLLAAQDAPQGDRPTRPEVGDILHCIAVPSCQIALPVSFQKPARKERPRLIVNEGLKNKVKLKTGVVMAKGPDGTNGFVEGWRPIPDVSQLPWAGLFSHLQTS